MQRVELAAIVIIASTVLVVFALDRLRRSGRQTLWLQVLVGSAIGLVAALVVLVLSVDLVPDDLETALGPVVVVVITGVAIAGSAIRLARR